MEYPNKTEIGAFHKKKVSWCHHKLNINRQVQKVSASFWACRKKFGKTWGQQHKAASKLYTLARLGITESNLANGVLFNIRTPSYYSEWPAAKTTIRLQFAGSWKEETFWQTANFTGEGPG